MEIRSLTIPYSKNKAKNVRDLEKQLESCIESLENDINANLDDGTDAEQEYERLKTELRRIYGKRADGAILRSKIRWIEHEEKPAKYFFNMECRNDNKKTITELTVAGGTTISNDDDILEEIRGFSENLYKTDLREDSTLLFQGFTENLRTKLPKLLGDQRDLLEGKLTLEECRRAGSCVFCAPLDRCVGRYINRCIGRHIDRYSTDMSVNISTVTRPIYRPRYVGQHIDRYVD